MYGSGCSRLLTLLFLSLPPALLSGQSARIPNFALPPPATPRPVSPSPLGSGPGSPGPVSPGTIDFGAIARAAGTIFSGTVTAIVHESPTSRRPIDTVKITFHVQRAIRGATPGELLTVSQWMGLWSSGQRYRVGERVLLFLYPPSQLGLSSCVGALIGRFRVDPVGRVLLSPQHLSAFRDDPVLGGKSRVYFSDLARAVQRTSVPSARRGVGDFRQTLDSPFQKNLFSQREVY